MEWVAIFRYNGHYSVQSPVKALENYSSARGERLPEHALARIEDGMLDELEKIIGQIPGGLDMGILAERLRQKGIEAMEVRVLKMVQQYHSPGSIRNARAEEIPVVRRWRG